MTKAIYENITRFCHELDKISIFIKEKEIKTCPKDTLLHEKYIVIDTSDGKLHLTYDKISHILILRKKIK